MKSISLQELGVLNQGLLELKRILRKQLALVHMAAMEDIVMAVMEDIIMVVMVDMAVINIAMVVVLVVVSVVVSGGFR